MATIGHLSGSTDGKAILIAATATPGTLVHTATTATDQLDRIWLYAVNTSASTVKLTLEWGEATAPNGNIEFKVPAESGAYLLTDGFPLQNALIVRAFAATTNVVTLHGYVVRATVAESFS